MAQILCQNNRFMEVNFGGMCGNPAFACLTKKVYHCERPNLFKLEIKLRSFTVLLMLQLNEVKFMDHNFKGKFYALIFFVSFGLLYKVNVPDTTGLITVAVNSSCSHKLAILSFTCAVNTFLSSVNNGGKSIDSNVFVLVNVKGLHNPN